ncbi:MAG: peptidoglycan-binding domain-containing protein [Candidatus Paceibacterota bacterium]|jgi:peptidoglycan hydrolase-like protein with peptidoglycan-binding domain
MKKNISILSVFIFVFMLFGFNFNTAKAATTPAPDCVITSTLRLGSKGEEVACLQAHLGLTADGVFGRRTREKVKDWQLRRKLNNDGVLGAMSRAALEENSTSPEGNRNPTLNPAPAPTPTDEIITTTPAATSVTVLTPNGGETFKKDVTQKIIRWSDTNNISTHEIKLISYPAPCTTGIGTVCPPFVSGVYTIANTQGSSFAWAVGKTWENDSVPDGSYKIQICQTSTTNCDSSDGTFFIVSDTTSPTTFTITTSSPLPNATVGNQYKSYIYTSNGFGSYTWSFMAGSGSMPSGIVFASSDDCGVTSSMSNVSNCTLLFGTPTIAGTYTFTLQAKDNAISGAGAAVATKQFTLTVNPTTIPVTPSITLLSPNGGEIFTAGQQMTVRWQSSNVPTTEGLVIQMIQANSINDIIGSWIVLTYSTPNDGIETFNLDKNLVPGKYELSIKRYVGAGDTMSDGLFTINASVATTPSCTITATPSYIMEGGTSRLNWDCKNVNSVKLTPGNIYGYPSAYDVHPTMTTRYTLNYQGTSGSGDASVDVTVDHVGKPTIISLLPAGCSINTGYSSTTGLSCSVSPTSANIGDRVYVYGSNFIPKCTVTTMLDVGGSMSHPNDVDCNYVSPTLVTFVIGAYEVAGNHHIKVTNSADTFPVSNTVYLNFTTSTNTKDGNIVCPYARPLAGYHWEGMQPYPVCGGYLVKDASGDVMGAETFHFTQTLKNGSKGNEVVELQKFLNAAGYYNGKFDGKFGKGTRVAVINWQKSLNLKADGSFGAMSRAAIENNLTPTPVSVDVGTAPISTSTNTISISTQVGLPVLVEAKRQAIFQAALSRDLVKFKAESSDTSYTFSDLDVNGKSKFGLSGFTKFSGYEKDISLFDLYPVLLNLPFTVSGNLYTWPSVATKNGKDFLPSELTYMKTFLTDEQIESLKGYYYTYPHITITSEGKWINHSFFND